MTTKNRLARGIACGGLTLALLGGVAPPAWAGTTCTPSSAKTAKIREDRQEVRAACDKLMAQAKAEDAVLEKLVAELNQAPETKKVDLEAMILTKLVAQHHEMVSDWASLQARVTQLHKDHMMMSRAGKSHS